MSVSSPLSLELGSPQIQQEKQDLEGLDRAAASLAPCERGEGSRVRGLTPRIGGIPETRMHDFCGEHDITAEVEVIPMKISDASPAGE